MLTQDAFNLTDADFRLISDVVREHCGISLSEVKKDLVRGRLARQIRTGGFASARDYIDYVFGDRNGAGFAGFIDAISTNLTSFFREDSHFQYLTQTFVPAWLARDGSASRCLLAWSAGCSTGEEAYSIAMTLADAFRAAPGSKAPEIRILASDISTRVLETARIGIYPASRLTGVLPHQLSQYFRRIPSAAGAETCYEVSPELRAMIRFRHLNLINPWPLRTKYMTDLLARKAMLDGLTGLWNRAYLEQFLASKVSLGRRHGHICSLIMADVDCFKSINDQHGHPFGDEVLRHVSRTIVTGCRREDVVCRYGGEEFAIVAPLVDVTGATMLAEHLREAISGLALRHRDTDVSISCSFGVAQVCLDADASPFEKADAALYRAKRAGRNCVVSADLPQTDLYSSCGMGGPPMSSFRRKESASHEVAQE